MTSRAARGGKVVGDRVFAALATSAGISVLVLLGAIIVMLFVGGLPAFRAFGLRFLTSTDWDPGRDIYGAVVPVFGTIVTSVIALMLAVPLAFGIAFYLTEQAPPWLTRPVGTAVELLAAVPSIIYGMWGFFVIVPIMSRDIEPVIIHAFRGVPLLHALFRGPPFGTGLLTAALVLAIMVVPFIAATMRDVFNTVPPMFKESAYGLGCTTWEVMRSVVLPYTRTSVVGGIMLGLGRALGETMAVTFVIGNTDRISTSLFGAGNTISSLVALEFPESATDPLRFSSLLALGFLLFVISFAVLAVSRSAAAPTAAAHGRQMSAAIDTPLSRPAASTARSLARRRRLVDLVARGLCLGATVISLVALVSILATLVYLGAGGLHLAVFTRMTLPPGSRGGLLNAIVGSIVQTGLGTLIGTPVGLLVGTYLSEYAAQSRLGGAVRFVSDVLLSAPSILIGLFIYTIVVRPMGGFSGLAGALSLAIIVVPIVVRTTEDMLRLIPLSLREAAIALGAPKWRGIVFVCYRAAINGIVTGVLLAIARVAGETAPLLFTSLGNLNWSLGLGRPMSSLPVTIYQYAGSAFADWVSLAWVGALLITAGVLALNIAARFALGRRG